MHNKAAVTLLIIATFAGAIAFIEYQVININNKVNNFIQQYPQQIADATNMGIEKIEHAVDNEIQYLTNSIAQKYSKQLKSEIEEDISRIEALKSEIRSLQQRKEAAELDIPEIVSLDDLGKKYTKLKATRQSGYIERDVLAINTNRGTITFRPSEIEIARVPSTGLVAWIRIGKKNSTEDEELIKAWLSESIQAKKALGYIYVYRKSKTDDYGEYFETKYSKGDSYIITYFRYIRTLETYNRYSMRYTYYIEVGSDTRKQQYMIEQYNSTNGS